MATAVGYTGGHTKNPTYAQVCGKTTGHAEAVLIEFDPKKVSFKKLLEKVQDEHNPIQNNAAGGQYRNAIFAYSDEQKAVVNEVFAKASEAKFAGEPIGTLISRASEFWLAEDYHQQYYAKRGIAAKCPVP